MRSRIWTAAILSVLLVAVFALPASAEFFKYQQRRGLAIGPRLGVFMPEDKDISEHVPMMFQTGIDIKGYLALSDWVGIEAKSWGGPWISLDFGLGFMGGGSQDEEDFNYTEEVDDNGDGEAETLHKSRKIDTYWATMMLPATAGIAIECLPHNVFDPYFGGGVGYYIVSNVYPIVDELPDEYTESRAPSDFSRAGVMGYYGVFGLDVKFHDYMGVKVEGSYHMVDGGEDLNDANLSGMMVSVGSLVFF